MVESRPLLRLRQCNPCLFLPACSYPLHSHSAFSCFGRGINSLPAQSSAMPYTFTPSSVLHYAHHRMSLIYGEHTNCPTECGSPIQAQEGQSASNNGVSGNACAFQTCASLGHVQLLHYYIEHSGLMHDPLCGHLLVDLYVEQKSLNDAAHQFERLVEPDIFSWNTMISGYVTYDFFSDALQCYRRMCCAGFTPNDTTYIHVLDACAHIGSIDDGRLVHGDMIHEHYVIHLSINEALISMYANCAALEDALKIFNELPQRSAMSWSALIVGHAECGHVHEGFQLFRQMEEEGVQPSEMTYAYVLQACCYSTADSEAGRPVHLQIVKQGFDLVEMISIWLLDMYATCGQLNEAEHLFHRFPNHSNISWSVMIAGFAQHGDVYAALRYFELMKSKNIRPNEASFLDILCACNDANLTDLGSMFFKALTGEFGILPSMENCVCMVDFLGRRGNLKEAEDLILQMPHVADAMLWVSFLGICNKYNNVEIGKRAFAHFMRCESKIGAGYKLMASIYAVNLKL
ncbi:hypothetical protein GOP47_0030336 [Adiantum capillus-veneris]|nr:hypothetical protein GOP47_0030336 [Adiantum capillus-veneris]